MIPQVHPHSRGEGPSHRSKAPSKTFTSRDEEDFLALQLRQVQFQEYKGMEKD